ncbi:hypothetical protein GTHT12_02085 [Geobacillus thermodenitrificans]|jgi:hypothetical protein|nr:hypothetical protein GTHT12_02085 [Geobacillus thermodenitrificans]KQB92425.1 putative membrane protein [Geobacillus sp. PA-3]MEC5187261.1 hypothetical protein [Geobacillus thermodenitrificans]
MSAPEKVLALFPVLFLLTTMLGTENGYTNGQMKHKRLGCC